MRVGAWSTPTMNRCSALGAAGSTSSNIGQVSLGGNRSPPSGRDHSTELRIGKSTAPELPIAATRESPVRRGAGRQAWPRSPHAHSTCQHPPVSCGPGGRGFESRRSPLVRELPAAVLAAAVRGAAEALQRARRPDSAAGVPGGECQVLGLGVGEAAVELELGERRPVSAQRREHQPEAQLSARIRLAYLIQRTAPPVGARDGGPGAHHPQLTADPVREQARERLAEEAAHPGQEQVPSDPRGRAGREQEVLVAVGSVRVQNADGEAENVANRLRQSASAGQPADNGVLTRSLQERHAPVAMHVVHGQRARIGESVRVEDAASAQPRERPESRGGSQPGRAPRRVLHGVPLQRGHVRSGRAAAAARPSRTPTPRAKDMWAPRKPLIASGRADAAVSRRPRVRFPLLRATYEAAFSDSATTFPAAWTRPIRRVPPLVMSLQSDRPAAAVGSDATIPSPTSRSAPRSDAPLKSSTAAIVQAPITASVASGWNGCPSQVPLSKSLSPAARIAESVSRASVSATPSSPDRVSVRAANCSSVLPRDAMWSGYPGPEPICRRSPGSGQLRQEPVGQRV